MTTSDATPTTSAPAPQAGGRHLWADVAKGACILLVVLWHVTRKDYLALPWDLPIPVTGAWGTLSEALLPVRMPLFFGVAGLVAARVVRRPWRHVWTHRVSVMLWLFVMWTLLHTAVLQLTPGFDTAVADGPLDLLVQLTVTPGNLWFLLALALYTVVARATRAVPVPAIAVALALSVVASAGWVPTPGNRAGLLVSLVWFLLGVHAAASPRLGVGLRALVTARLPVVLTLLAAFGVAAAGWLAYDADAVPGVRPALAVLGVVAGLAAAGALSRTTRLGSALAWVGRRTLPVYVIHLPLVALAHLASVRLVDGRAAESLLLATTYPVLVTAVVVALCLILQRVIETGPLRWLLAPPWRAVSSWRRFHPAPDTAQPRIGLWLLTGTLRAATMRASDRASPSGPGSEE